MNDKAVGGDVGGAREKIASFMAWYHHACYNCHR